MTSTPSSPEQEGASPSPVINELRALRARSSTAQRPPWHYARTASYQVRTAAGRLVLRTNDGDLASRYARRGKDRTVWQWQAGEYNVIELYRR